LWTLLRSLLWLAALVMLLPPAEDGSEPPLRAFVVDVAHAARDRLELAAETCATFTEACPPAPLAALPLLVGRSEPHAAEEAGAEDLGTLTGPDLEPAWSVASRTGAAP
jgi:hypothetical protein